MTPLHSSRTDGNRALLKLVAFTERPATRTIPAMHRPRLSFRAVNLPNAPGYDPALQRHHLLPRQLLSKRCFDALFKLIGQERLGFDDFRVNGLLLPAIDAAALRTGLPLHRGPHCEYNAMVIERVGQVEAQWAALRLRSPRLAHREAAAGLRSLQDGLRRSLLAPGSRRLALNRFDPLSRSIQCQIDAMVDTLWSDSDPLRQNWPDHRSDQLAPFIAAGSASALSPAVRLAWAC